MTMQVWLILFCGIAVISLICFLLFFTKDSRLRVERKLESRVLLLDCGLLCISLMAIGAAIMLYLNWQEQLNQFIG